MSLLRKWESTSNCHSRESGNPKRKNTGTFICEYGSKSEMDARFRKHDRRMKCHSRASGNPVKKKTLDARFGEHDKKESIIPLKVGINSTLVIPA